MKLTLGTLTLASILPFLEPACLRQFWYRPDIIKNLVRTLKVVATLGICYATYSIYELFQSKPNSLAEDLHVSMLHYFPLAFLLLPRQGRYLATALQQQNSSETPYTPTAVNNQVEHVSWDALIVADSLKEELFGIVELLKNPSNATRYGIDLPKGILLSGPPGTGKTSLAKAVASNAGLAFFVLKVDEIVSKWVGDSEKNLTSFFAEASRNAPAVIFIDEIDSLGAARAAGNSQHSDKLLNHLLQLIDGVVKSEGVYIIAATNRVELVDAALLRGGRLGRVIEVPLPDFESRQRLFTLYLAKLNLQEEVNIEALSEYTEGFSPATIKQICNQAGLNAFKRETGSAKREYKVQLRDLELALEDFLKQPNVAR